TTSMIRPQNSSKARAAPSSFPLACLVRSACGRASQRGSSPTHTALPRARMAADRRSAKCSMSLPDAEQDRRTRVADLHDKVDRHMSEYADRHVVDRLGIRGSPQNEMPRAAGPQQGLALTLDKRHARRQRVAVDSAQVPEQDIE